METENLTEIEKTSVQLTIEEALNHVRGKYLAHIEEMTGLGVVSIPENSGIHLLDSLLGDGQEVRWPSSFRWQYLNSKNQWEEGGPDEKSLSLWKEVEFWEDAKQRAWHIHFERNRNK